MFWTRSGFLRGDGVRSIEIVTMCGDDCFKFGGIDVSMSAAVSSPSVTTIALFSFIFVVFFGPSIQMMVDREKWTMMRVGCWS